VVSEHPRKGVSQEAMSVATATLNSWKGWDLSREPNLSGADLREADLPRVDLPRADLSEANLCGTNLTEADLSGAELVQAQLEETRGDENTVLPPGLKPPAHWGVKTDEQGEEDCAHPRTSENATYRTLVNKDKKGRTR
jgi:hypothetical protein